MRLRDLSEVKVEVIGGGSVQTGWAHDGSQQVRIVNPLNGKIEAELHPSGLLLIMPGYMCDGPSGPTFDDASNRIPALVHDVAYQLLRQGCKVFTRKDADKLMYKMLREHGMGWFRAKFWYNSLRVGGRSSARPRKEKKYTYLSA